MQDLLIPVQQVQPAPDVAESDAGPLIPCFRRGLIVPVADHEIEYAFAYFESDLYSGMFDHTDTVFEGVLHKRDEQHGFDLEQPRRGVKVYGDRYLVTEALLLQ